MFMNSTGGKSSKGRYIKYVLQTKELNFCDIQNVCCLSNSMIWQD